ncbi:MAG: S-adenosylmethionine decarboxylase [Massilia sp.]|nr:S-adenosylmethionine decarboxylase [Aquabacterium sp.]
MHTWPESGVVILDVFVCNRRSDNSASAHQVLNQLLDEFKPSRCQVQEVPRIAQNCAFFCFKMPQRDFLH